MLTEGVENAQHLADGTTGSRGGAVEAACDAIVGVAMERGDQRFRISVTGTGFVFGPARPRAATST